MVYALMGALKHALKPYSVFPEVVEIPCQTHCVRFINFRAENTSQSANLLQMLTIADFSMVIICRFCIIIPETGLHI